MKNPVVFLLGCPRSGTTLLRRMVSAHPQIAIVPEIRWLAPTFSRREGLTPEGFLTPAFFERLRNLGRFSPVPLDADALAALAASHATLSYADFMTILFDAYGKKNGKALVGHKNADHAAPMDIATLHALWPAAKFVHLVRDGRDVCLSVLNWRVRDKVARLFPSWDEARVPTIAAWWEWQIRLSREAGLALGPERYREIRYEAMVTHPEDACARLCEFVGVPYDGAMLRFHENPPRKDAKQAWLPPTPGRRDWRSQMPPADQALFEAVAGDLLAELGYPVAAAGPSAADRATARAVRAAFPLRPLPHRWGSTPPHAVEAPAVG